MKNKRVAIINSENKKIISAIKNVLKDKAEILEKDTDLTNYDLIVLTGYESNFETNFTNKEVINIHPSLLPAFKEGDAITESYLYGVKVSGVTIHKVEKGNFFGKILAQYPVLIGLETHLEEFKNDYSFALAILNENLYDHIKKDAKAKGRFIDYGLKRCIKMVLKDLIKKDVITRNDSLELEILIDNQTIKSNGLYDLEKSIQKELTKGMKTILEANIRVSICI